MDSKTYMQRSLTRDLPSHGYEALIEGRASDPTLIRQLHAAIGMSGETGEIADMIKKHLMYGKEPAKADLLNELGDVLWYMAIMIDSLGSSFEEVMQMNDDKLSKRYPQGFSETAAVTRADEFISLEEIETFMKG